MKIKEEKKFKELILKLIEHQKFLKKIEKEENKKLLKKIKHRKRLLKENNKYYDLLTLLYKIVNKSNK